MDDLIHPDVWFVADRVIQWLVLPLLVGWWHLIKRMDGADREILRIVTMLEERANRRLEDRDEQERAIAALTRAIEKLEAKIDKLTVQGAQ